uniref:Uncharacterized protein n=1 Tax=Timema tahoe TaxID=61484 RepID=A0A7R9ISN2_9NEOP|nr:unnamed protein product [Timema tahoe]
MGMRRRTSIPREYATDCAVLTEESKPWLEPFVKPEVQESQEKQYELGSSRLQTVNKSTTKEKKTQKILPQVLASVFVASFHIVVGISMAYSAILVPQLETDELSIDKSASAWLGK